MMATGADHIEIRLPRRPEFVQVARKAAQAIAVGMDMTWDVVKDVEMAVGEACANVVEHVCAEGCPEFHIIFGVSESELIIEVRDHGQGFDTSEVGIMPELDDDIDTRGFGILIIRELMDEVEIECCPETGTCVRMRKRRQQL
jgi:serine/threonine-protein kinase RsbW